MKSWRGGRQRMALIVEKPGMRTTVQDRGRKGWQRYGVPVSGPMDELSFRTANALVGNEEDAAGLEMALSGGTFHIAQEAVIAVCGADMEPSIDGERLPMWRPVHVRAGGKLRFGTAVSGVFTYLAVAGGLQLPKLLGSRSASLRSGFPDLAGRGLAAGDRLPIGVAAGHRMQSAVLAEDEVFRAPHWYVGDEWRRQVEVWSDERLVRAMRGKEWDEFDEEARELVERGQWVCTVRPDSDRMGYRLNSAPVRIMRHGEMLSEAVTAGTVQVPPDGLPIALMADRQTTGGYPRFLQIAAADLGILAQARPGERVRLKLVELDEAVRALAEREQLLSWLRRRLRWTI